ncbi:MAG: septum site-determining protein MinC [Saccharospirillum sp.]|uniref:septum site-determining protein MinC n=1 Tax=Saccharospirillum sp. TaxID=2033801 RepID=UPI00329935C3
MTDTKPMTVRARMLPIQRLIIDDLDSSGFAQRLTDKLEQAPALFNRAPVALDVGAVLAELTDSTLQQMLDFAREQRLVVFALAGPKEALTPWCERFNLAWVDDKDRATRASKAEAAAAGLETQVIRQPVRSGQQIYARGAHLLIMNQVSSGAEVIADGSIHVYGALRGRAMAGVQGDTLAEIVCQNLDADLLAIAGNYQVRDDLNAELNRPTRVRLENGQLVIEQF